jgi:hypothetical protein
MGGIRPFETIASEVFSPAALPLAVRAPAFLALQKTSPLRSSAVLRPR